MDVATFYCSCGAMEFVATFPVSGEERIAVKMYSRQIEERNLFQRIHEDVKRGRTSR